MAEFNSPQAAKRWQSLQNSAGSSLNNIVQGRASTADFSRVSSVLNGLSSLAATTFSQAISASEVQAKKFEASYAQLEQGIRSDNADNLTAYEKALNAALQTIEPNIIGTIKEFIELSSLESNEDLTKTLNTGFSGVHEALPNDIPSTHDLLAANDLLEESLLEADANRWQTRESSLIEKIADVFKTTLRDLAEQISKERAAKQAHASHSGHLALAAPHGASGNALVPFQHPHAMHDVIDMEPHTIADNAMQLVRPAEHAALTDQTGGMEPHTKSSVASSSSISLSASAEQAITKAATDQTSLYQKLMDFLQKSDDSTVDQKEEDQDRADAFWNSYKSIVGDPSKSKKKSSSDEGWGWLKTLGSALLLMATNPQLFKTIGDLITKYATWDNLKKAVGEAWDWVGKQAHDVLDWVLDKLGANKAIQAGNAAVKNNSPLAPILNAKNEKGKSTLQKIGDALVTPDEQKWISQNVLHSKSLGQTGQAIEDAVVTPDQRKYIANKWNQFTGDSSSSSTGGTTNNSGESTTTVGGSTVNVGGNRSTVNGGTVVNSNSSSTSSVPAQAASMMPGASVPNAGVTAGMGATAGTGDNRPSKGGPQIGMSTFGFHTGTDDSLMMMNTPYFTG